MLARLSIPGICLIFLGLVSLVLIGTADWLVNARDISFGPRQLIASLPSIATILAGAILVREHRAYETSVRIHRFALVIGVLAGITSVLTSLVVLEPGRAFQHDSTTGAGKVYKRVVQVAGLNNVGICRCAPAERYRINLPGGFGSYVSVYDNGGAEPRPGVVIAHGNVWMGGNLSTYRLLGSRLARKGIIVATFDFPGFGEADSPYINGPSGVADASDRVVQINAVVDFLLANTKVDENNIAVFGHSGGVEWAMYAASSNPAISKVAVMVAPPPPAFAGVSMQQSTEYSSARDQYFEQRADDTYRYVYQEAIPAWDAWKLREREIRYPDDPWRAFMQSGHKPILLLLGEHDQPDGHTAVLDRFNTLAGPKKMFLIHRSDHYANTAQILGFVVYDRGVARQLVDTLADWLGK